MSDGTQMPEWADDTGHYVVRPVSERAGFLAQIEACRREVAMWPEWMRQERTVPAWMASHTTDL